MPDADQGLEVGRTLFVHARARLHRTAQGLEVSDASQPGHLQDQTRRRRRHNKPHQPPARC